MTVVTNKILFNSYWKAEIGCKIMIQEILMFLCQTNKLNIFKILKKTLKKMTQKIINNMRMIC